MPDSDSQLLQPFIEFITAGVLGCAVFYAAVRFLDDVLGCWLRRRE